MEASTPAPRRWQLLNWGAGLYLLFAIGRSFYESETFSGLYGQFADWQMRFFNSFDLNETFGATFLVYLLPFLAAVSYSTQAQKKRVVAEAALPSVADLTRTMATGARRIALAGAGLILASVAAYFVLPRQAAPDQPQAIARLALDAAGAPDHPVDPKTPYVELAAVCQTRDAWGWVRTRSSEKTRYRYLPLTGRDWQPGQPVRFIYPTTLDGHIPSASDGRQRWHLYDGPPFPSTFEGELKRDALPLFARHGLERSGVVLASPCYVLEPMDLHGQTPAPGVGPRQMIPYSGSFFGLGLIVVGGLLYGRRERFAAGVMAARARAGAAGGCKLVP